MKLPKFTFLQRFCLPKITLPTDKKQRFAIIFLGFGAVLIIVLLGVLFYASYQLKSTLKTSINAYLEQVREDMPTLQYAPFDCSGVASISCASPYIALIDTLEARDISLGFGKMGDKNKLNAWVEIKEIEFLKDTSAHSLLRVFFALPKVDLSDILFPTYINCELENVLLDSSLTALQNISQNVSQNAPQNAPQNILQNAPSQIAHSPKDTQEAQNLDFASKDSRTHISHTAKCNLKAQNMHYHFKAQAQQSLQIPHESQHIKDILTHIYKSYLKTPNAFMEESRIWIDSINLTLKPSGLDSAIIKWLKKQNPIIAQNPTQQTPNNSKKSQEAQNIAMQESINAQEKTLKERFDNAITESANIATYTFSFVSNSKDTRKAIMEGVNSFSNLLQGKSTQASYEFLPKHTRYFRLSDIVSAPSAVLNLANFSLKVKQSQTPSDDSTKSAESSTKPSAKSSIESSVESSAKSKKEDK
ncbi:hypothetical protein [Helicobacter sp. T3_23-1056]